MTGTAALARLANPDNQLLTEYWRTLPKEYFRVVEDPEAARRHLAALVELVTEKGPTHG